MDPKNADDEVNTSPLTFTVVKYPSFSFMPFAY